jgi:hypothetical protein
MLLRAIRTISICLCLLTCSSQAQVIAPTHIITAPSAVMSSDGQIEFGLDVDEWGKHAQLNYQVTPWLNMGVDYSHFSGSDFLSATASYAYHAQVQIVAEGDRLPSIVVGMEDFTRQADIQSQYVVASKHFDQWRLDLGYAMGKQASSWDGGVLAAQYTFADYPVAVSAQYMPQIDEPLFINTPPMTNYDIHQDAQSLRPNRHAKWAVQAKWQISPHTQLSLTHSDDNRIGLGLTVAFDTKRAPTRIIRPAKSKVVNAPASIVLASDAPTPWRQQLTSALYDIDIKLHSLVRDNTRLQVVLSQSAYPYWPDAINQAHLVVLQNIPSAITYIDYVIQQDGHPVYRISRDVIRDVIRGKEIASFVKDMTPRGLTQSMLDQYHSTNDDPDGGWQTTYPDITAQLAHQGWLGESQEKMNQLLQARVNLNWEFAPGWSIHQQTQIDLAERWYRPNGIVTESLIDHDVHLSQLLLRYANTRITTNYDTQAQYDYQVFAGLLDNQWAGLGAVGLYQPWQSRVSMGATIGHLHKRDSSDTLTLDQQTGSVALASVYWASPFYHLDVALHAGRFVYQDTGAKLQVRRTFDNGWQFGIWASRTSKNDMTETQQGLYLSIPLDNVFNSHSRYNGNVSLTSHIAPLQNTRGVMLDSVTEARWWQLRAARYSVFQDSQLPSTNISQASATATGAWRLIVGQYQVQGQVTPHVNEDGQRIYVFSSEAGDEIHFTRDGLAAIKTLAKRPLQLTFSDSTAADTAEKTRNIQRRIRIGDLNYAAYLCSALVKEGYTATQMCQSQPVHRIQIQYNSDFDPVLIEQWLPYLQQHLQLNRLN